MGRVVPRTSFDTPSHITCATCEVGGPCGLACFVSVLRDSRSSQTWPAPLSSLELDDVPASWRIIGVWKITYAD